MMSSFLMVAYGIDPGFLRACDQTLAIVLTACRFLTPSLMGIALLYTIGRGFISGSGLAMDWGPIIKATWIFFLLFFYQSLMDTLGTGIAAFTALFATDQSAAEALSALTTPPAVAAAASNDNIGMGDIVSGAAAMISSISDTLSSFTFSGIMTRLFTATTVLIVREIMTFLQQFILGFLYVSGPIAMTLSVIPAFGQLALKWLQNFLAVQMWGLTFVLLDTMYGFFADTQRVAGGILASGGPAQSVDDTKLMLMSVAFVLLYSIVPYLTSLFIGSSAVQGFAGQMAGMAVGAATTVAGVASPGGGGLASAVGRAMGNAGGSGGSSGGSSSGGSTGGGGGSSAGSSEASSSASSGLPSITMSDALNPSYRQRASGLWTT
ncbi:hypothetical protein SAMN00120144_3101 [Hymenobacter roseosalivarius DSM 11622]|uniref:TrbL/VirB6 plasmid conjugal transfer protein n=1 Tax=Hymenobacter roseosalivarius DSM 11622 TaxID=645990 RepID=A0A1W1UDT2_9BACT|nr:hypothetical protein [Hymenobacter roseosalivarius]SMB79266.1 hypothetical protein SAMN00120144_3101 [Hymenobacter roseosalivarius DSM 11622]